MEGIVIAFLVVAVVLTIKGVTTVPQANNIVIERLGKFNRVLHPGLNFIIPFIDGKRTFKLGRRVSTNIDLREQVMDFPPQSVITRDNVTMEVDSIIYFQIMDPVKAMYEIADVTLAIEQLAKTTMRNIMGELDLDQSLTSRETINTKLRIVLDEATDKWGVKVTRVELKDITPPRDIQDAMAKQMTAERERRATVTQAEGEKTARILRAEGERESEIARAQGEKQALILKAEGEAEYIIRVNKATADAIKITFSAIHDGNPTNDLIAIKYLETMQKMAEGSANKVFIPYEAAAMMGSIGSLKELFDKDKTPAGGGVTRPAAPQPPPFPATQPVK